MTEIVFELASSVLAKWITIYKITERLKTILFALKLDETEKSFLFQRSVC